MSMNLKLALGLKRDEVYRKLIEDQSACFNALAPKYSGSECYCVECLSDLEERYRMTAESRQREFWHLIDEYRELLTEWWAKETERKELEEAERYRERLINEFNERIQGCAEEVRDVKRKEAKTWANEEMTLGDITEFLRNATEDELVDFRALVLGKEL